MDAEESESTATGNRSIAADSYFSHGIR